MIDPQLVSRALAIIGSNPANRDYFFANLHSPDWLEPLREAGRFRTPIHALRDERGISFPVWPESGYLARMAGKSPELVRDIIIGTEKTDNERVHQDFVEAALSMTADAAANVGGFEAKWIREQRFLYTLYPEKAGALIAHLANAGKVDAALTLARELLLIVPPAQSAENEKEDSFRFPPEPGGKCRLWEYEQILSRYVPDLTQAAPERTLRLLIDILETALRIHAEGHQERSEDYSWIWRPQIEFKHLDSYTEALVSATRDATIAMSSSAENTAKAAEFLWSRKWRMFRRLAYHVLRKSPTAPLNQIENVLTDYTEFEDFPGHSPEFDKLLAERFATLTDSGKAKVFSFLENGPDLSGLKQRKEVEGTPATEDELAEISDLWRLRWLHQIRADLPSVWHERYLELAKRFGQPHDDPAAVRVGTWVGPTSPKSPEQLQELNGDQLIEFLRTWQSDGGWNTPSPEGLGRNLSAMLAADPEKLARNATLLRGLDPTYIRSAIEGFTTAIKNQKGFDWSSIFELCKWVLSQGNTRSSSKGGFDHDPDWNWSRKSIGWFLIEALKVHGNDAVPLSERQRVWSLLESLANDPVPEESSYGKGVFFGSISLNVTRGVALDGMLQYARWLHRSGVLSGAQRILNGIPELQSALEEHLANDKSVVAREVWGRNFVTLFWLDSDWATKAASNIFGEQYHHLGEVAWANFLLFCAPQAELVPTLTAYYRQAIPQMGTGFRKDVDEIDRHLAQHIMLLYWRGIIDLNSDDGLIRTFFNTAPHQFRSHAIEYIGRNLYGASAIDDAIRGRLIRLWEWRLSELKKRRGDNEAAPFGIWFASGQFDIDWSFENLTAVLRMCGKAELDFWVVERLAQVAQQRPAAAVQALGMMIEGDQNGWAMHGWGEHPRTVLETALNTEDNRARQEAQRVIHLVGSRGWYGYRNLSRHPSGSN